MKKKQNNSAKVAVISSLVVIVLVGVSIFSIHSLVGNKQAENLKLSDIDRKEALANTSSSKVLSRTDAPSVDYIAVGPEVVYDEPVEEEAAELPAGMLTQHIVCDSFT